MKKFILLMFCFFSALQYGLSQSIEDLNKEIDSLTNKTDSLTDKINSLADNTNSLQESLDSTKKELIDSLKSISSKKECNCEPEIEEIKGCEIGKWFLVFSPFLLLILMAWIVGVRLKDFKFTEALTENEPPKKTIKNPEYNAPVIVANASIPNLQVLFPPTIEISNLEPTLSELKEIAAAKEAAVSTIKILLANAEQDKPPLDMQVEEAQKELDNAVTAASPPDPDVIVAAEEKLKTAKETVIVRLKGLLKMAEEEEANAKKKVEITETAIKSNTVYSVNTYRPSISRYIAFITSMVIIILVVCMSSFFIYHYIRTGCPPEFGALTAILIALGLGVTPYLTNRISTAATTNRS